MDERNLLLHEILMMMRDMGRAVRTEYVVRQDIDGIRVMDGVIEAVSGLKERAEGASVVSKSDAKEATTSIPVKPPEPAQSQGEKTE